MLLLDDNAFPKVKNELVTEFNRNNSCSYDIEKDIFLDEINKLNEMIL